MNWKLKGVVLKEDGDQYFSKIQKVLAAYIVILSVGLMVVDLF